MDVSGIPNVLELDGNIGRDVDRSTIAGPASGRATLVTYATCRIDPDLETAQWSGGFVKPLKRTRAGKKVAIFTLDVDLDKDILIFDRDFCAIELPTIEQVRAMTGYPQAAFACTLKLEDRGKELAPSRWEPVWKDAPDGERLYRTLAEDLLETN